MADILAGWAAENNAVETQVVSEIESEEELAYLLCLRLASIDALVHNFLEMNEIHDQLPEPFHASAVI